MNLSLYKIFLDLINLFLVKTVVCLVLDSYLFNLRFLLLLLTKFMFHLWKRTLCLFVLLYKLLSLHLGLIFCVSSLNDLLVSFLFFKQVKFLSLFCFSLNSFFLFYKFGGSFFSLFLCFFCLFFLSIKLLFLSNPFFGLSFKLFLQGFSLLHLDNCSYLGWFFDL